MKIKQIYAMQEKNNGFKNILTLKLHTDVLCMYGASPIVLGYGLVNVLRNNTNKGLCTFNLE